MFIDGLRPIIVGSVNASVHSSLFMYAYEQQDTRWPTIRQHEVSVSPWQQKSHKRMPTREENRSVSRRAPGLRQTGPRIPEREREKRTHRILHISLQANNQTDRQRLNNKHTRRTLTLEFRFPLLEARQPTGMGWMEVCPRQGSKTSSLYALRPSPWV